MPIPSMDAILDRLRRLRDWANDARYRSPEMREIIPATRDWLTGTPQRAARTKRVVKFGGPVTAIALAAMLYFWLRPYPQPDYGSGRIDALMNFTLLRDEFNALSVDERLKLLGQLRERLAGLTPGEGVLLAAFAGGIMDEAREQLEENASRLAIDMWDQYAREYQYVEEENRGQYLDETFVSFVRAMETLGGQPSEQTDSEILRAGHEQAREDEQRMAERGGPGGTAMGIMFSVMNNNVATHAEPQQRMRGQQMMRDMVRHMRGG